MFDRCLLFIIVILWIILMVVKDSVLEDVAKVLSKIKEQLNSSVLESSWGGCIYLGKSEIAFSTPSRP
jgi:Na+/proline symporter